MSVVPPQTCAAIVLDVFALAFDRFEALTSDCRTQFCYIAHLNHRHKDQVAWMRKMWLHLVHKRALPSIFDCWIRDLNTPMGSSAPRNKKQMLADLCFTCGNRMRKANRRNVVEITVPDVGNNLDSLVTIAMTEFVERLRTKRKLTADECTRAEKVWLYYFEDNVIALSFQADDDDDDE